VKRVYVEDASGEEILVSIDIDACATLADVRRAVAKEARNVTDTVAEPHALDLYLEEMDELVPFEEATMEEVREALSLRLSLPVDLEDGSRKKKKKSSRSRRDKDED